ncbi:MAG: lysylphosphatidylglycerol synthase transmembrane domain-containing protein [Alphaproteobacteria bacterium]
MKTGNPPIDVVEQPSATPVAGEPPRDRKWLALLGILLLGVLVAQVGSADLLARLRNLGWRAALVPLPFALIALVDGWAWSFTLPRESSRGLGVPMLSMMRLAGESVNVLTPTAYLGGEPVKAMLLVDRGIDAADGTVSVVVAKTALTIGQVVFILLGIVLAMERFGLLRGGGVLFGALCLLGAAFTALLVRIQQREPFTRAVGLARRLGLGGPRTERAAEIAPRIDRDLRDFYSARGVDFGASTFLHFVGWLAGTLEMKVFADLVGLPLGWRDAFLVESLSQPLSAGAALVPGALGIREAGGVAIFSLLGLDASAGLAIWILRRLREAFFSALGLGFLVARRR